MPTASNGRVAIVTGAAHGIGAATVRHLATRGWHIAGADLDETALEAVAAETGAVPVACDVGSEAEVERLVAVARTRFGRIDAIVSNAGISIAASHPSRPRRWRGGTGCSPPT